MKSEPVKLEQIYKAPVSVIWEALMDKNQMKKWYFDIDKFVPEVGFEFSFEGGTEENKYVHLCKVIDVEENKKISYSWRYRGYDGESLVSFDLYPEGDQTKLVLIHSGLDTFPANNPDFDLKNFEMGWNDILTRSLKEFVEREFSNR